MKDLFNKETLLSIVTTAVACALAVVFIVPLFVSLKAKLTPKA